MRMLVIVVLLLVVGGCSANSEDEQVLARFEGGVITVADVEAHLQSMKRDSRFRKQPELLTPEFAFEHALNMEMIIARGLELNLHRDPVIRNKLHEQMSDLFVKLLQDQLIETIDRSSITDEEVRAFYEENKKQYLIPASYHVHAFSVAPEQVESVQQALTARLITFAEAARHYGLEEDERERGGDTGMRSLRRFQPEWRPVVKSLPVAEVVGPKEIGGKSYMLMLERKTEPKQRDFEKRKEYIRNDVLYSRYQNQWQDVYDELRRNYKVEIKDELLQRYTSSELVAATAAKEEE